MTPQEWEKVSELYHTASELESDERSAFLDKACDGDPTLRREVETLLAADGEAGDFISEPVVGAFASDLLKSYHPKPNEMIGHYRIISKIGSGGMGEVFLAVDTRLGRKVAIKTLSSFFDSDPNFLKRFRNEARAAATLNHPNVATVYAVDEHNGRPFIAMEYVEGKTLDHLFTDEGVDLATFARWFTPVIDAIGQAHAKGVIHRDIKPGNIIVTGDGTPKVLDFGLAYFQPTPSGAHSSLIHVTDDGQIIGTPSYMSPEQAEGKEIDHRTDIFSLGVVMYEALTGVRPFTGEGNAEIIGSLLKTEPIPAEEIRSSVPLPVSKVILKCLQKNRSDRPQSMKRLGQMLNEAVSRSNGAISAGSFARRLYHETRPRSIWPIAAVAFLVLFLALAGWYYFSSQPPELPLNFANMTMRRLSQSKNVAYAALSPDGKSVVYVTLEGNDDRSLWLRRVSETNAIQIVPPQPVQYWDCPAFSDDGEYIYYITAARGAAHGTLYRIPTLGGLPRKVVDKANHLGNLSPDGKRLLFVRYGDVNPSASVNTTETQIISANAADGSDERSLIGAAGETIFREPRFSSDGNSIYYVKRELSDGVEQWSIVKLPAVGGDEVPVLRQNERIGAIALLKNSSGLMMSARDPASNVHQLYHVSLPDGRSTRITNDLNYYIGVSVDRDARNIVTAQRSEENMVWVGDANDLTSLKPLSNGIAAHSNVEWTPDGKLVFDAYENNLVHIWISDADGRNAVRLTDSGSNDSEPKVSGDGRYIVFTSNRAGPNQIWRMNIDGSNQTLLAEVRGITQVPRFESDGKTVVFRWFNEGSEPLGRVDVAGGPVEGVKGLPTAAAYYWATSPDGKRVAYAASKGAENGIEVRSKGSDTPGVSLGIWPSVILKWMPDGRSLYYQDWQRTDGPRSKIWMIDMDSRQPQLLLSTEPDHVLDLSYSRDGKRVAIVRGKTAFDAVMLTAAAGAR
jgi:Tol biopolymer transport system component/predicted Ser/Thr protein kinase